MIVGVHHIAVSTPDLDKAVAFYTEGLGFEFIVERGWTPGPGTAGTDAVVGHKNTSARVGILKHSNCFLELFEYTHKDPVPRTKDFNHSVCDHGFAHLALQVTDIQNEYLRLERLGMRWHTEPKPMSGGNMATYGRDPFGNVIEIYEISDPTFPDLRRPASLAQA